MENRKKAQELIRRARGETPYDANEQLMRAAFILDPSNIDALMWWGCRVTLEDSDTGTAMLEDVVQIAARRLGPELFLRERGRFGDLPEARAYLRARAELARELISRRKRDRAREEIKEMFELDLRDSEGLRYDMIEVSLSDRKPADVRRTLARFPDEDSAFFLWARILERLQSGAAEEARDLLRSALAITPETAASLFDDSDMPRDTPVRYRPGCEYEGWAIGFRMQSPFFFTPGGLDWLRRHAG